ncbi:S1 RNA-binding domain-containing protein [Clostridium butyricum]|uniref:S1 RNA-binding domain-containing protein n=1 Tax=Clostridium butyricum TaxID=1492 RepID=UPI002AB1E299|nr:S1 RNA-binding domain-containing protein [Clostridium butyricum]
MNKDKKTIKLDDKLLEIDTDYNLLSGTDNEIIDSLKKAIDTNTYFTGLCTRCDSDGNLHIDINGIECIIERDEVSIITNGENHVHKGLCQGKVGQYLKAKVINIDDSNGDMKINLSRKDFVSQIRNLYENQLTVGTVITGKVTNIDETKGVFVDIGGDYTGIIPRSNLENLYVVNLTDHVRIGEKLEVVVLELRKDESGQIIHLSLDRKSLLPDFKELTKCYNRGDVVLAKVKSIQKTGIYCSLNKHLDIICDFTSSRYRTGQQLRVRIDNISNRTRKIVGIIESEL